MPSVLQIVASALLYDSGIVMRTTMDRFGSAIPLFELLKEMQKQGCNFPIPRTHKFGTSIVVPKGKDVTRGRILNSYNSSTFARHCGHQFVTQEILIHSLAPTTARGYAFWGETNVEEAYVTIPKNA